MIPAAIESGILLYEAIQVIVAFIALVLARKWHKSEFLGGLSFLFIYTILDLVDALYSVIMPGVFIEVAQFGFILLAIVFFIIGMHPSWSHRLIAADKKLEIVNKPRNGDTTVFNHLRKI